MATIDERPFCLECRGYSGGGTGVDEPVCCCDSDDESDDEFTPSFIKAEARLEVQRKRRMAADVAEHQRIMAAGAVKIAELEAKLEAKGLLTEAELEAKTKKPKKIKLKLKPKKKVIKLKFKKSVK